MTAKQAVAMSFLIFSSSHCIEAGNIDFSS